MAADVDRAIAATWESFCHWTDNWAAENAVEDYSIAAEHCALCLEFNPVLTTGRFAPCCECPLYFFNGTGGERGRICGNYETAWDSVHNSESGSPERSYACEAMALLLLFVYLDLGGSLDEEENDEGNA